MKQRNLVRIPLYLTHRQIGFVRKSGFKTKGGKYGTAKIKFAMSKLLVKFGSIKLKIITN